MCKCSYSLRELVLMDVIDQCLGKLLTVLLTSDITTASQVEHHWLCPNHLECSCVLIRAYVLAKKRRRLSLRSVEVLPEAGS